MATRLITAYFAVPTVTDSNDSGNASSGDEDDDDDDDEVKAILNNRDLTCTIYAYCENKSSGAVHSGRFPLYDPTVHGKPVYVGQTMQALHRRDGHHLAYCKTAFDRQYVRRGQYTLVTLEVNTFPAASINADYETETLKPACIWMDAREQALIVQHHTYTNGLNSTRGGQGWTTLTASLEATAKKSAIRWTDTYMPAFRAFYKTFKHINAPSLHPTLGNVIHSIRRGLTSIPQQFQAELEKMGGIAMDNQKDAQTHALWTDKYMPAFRAFYKTFKHISAPRSHSTLGKLIHNIRVRGNRFIPPQFQAELDGMGGIAMDNQKHARTHALWTDKYMPAFRAFYKTFKHISAPSSHPTLGVLIHNIRRGLTSIPQQFQAELEKMGGIAMDNQRDAQTHALWTDTYMPAFRAFYKTFKHINAPRSKIGALISSIRYGDTSIPQQFQAELDAMGVLFFDTRCVHEHARKAIKYGSRKTHAELVREAVAEHTRLLALRAELKKQNALKSSGLFAMPFGQKRLVIDDDDNEDASPARKRVRVNVV